MAGALEASILLAKEGSSDWSRLQSQLQSDCVRAPSRRHKFENLSQRDIERRRKAELYEQKNKEAENSRLARNLRALERNNQTQKIKKGRRLMKRSMNIQTKPTVAKSLEEFKDLLDLSEEDSSYFFM